MRVDYPVAIDSDHAIWRAFKNEYWPALYRNGLQDAKQRRIINADDRLRPIFKKDQVSMFDMTKLINRHLS